MALDKDLDDRIRQGIKDRDLKTVDVLRMLKTRLLERRTAKGFSGEVDDALVLEVIAAYRKQLQKALAEFEKLGERGAAQATQLRFEIGVQLGSRVVAAFRARTGTPLRREFRTLSAAALESRCESLLRRPDSRAGSSPSFWTAPRRRPRGRFV